MESFFAQIINETRSSKDQETLRDLYIFPSRRACVHFKKALASTLQVPAWSPTIISLADLVKQQYNGTIGDNLTLVFELYQIYANILDRSDHESFDEFFAWGDMMLRDFDEADRYLLNGEQLFREIRDLKNLEARFQPELTDYQTFQSFWQTFSNDPLSEMQQRFTTLWNRMGSVYAQFQSHLRQQKLAYEGMAYRELAENKLWVEELDFERIFLCGFHALTTSESEIFNSLVAKKEAQIFWDVDPFYLNNPKHEAGHFMRKNFRAFPTPESHWLEPKLTGQPKKIEVVGIAGKVSQGQVAGLVLQRWLGESDFHPDKTAVIFPDESLLLPVLHAIPQKIDHINITMGYPMQLSTTYSFVDAWLLLHRDVRTTTDRFSHEQVLSLLSHPFIQSTNPEAAKSLQQTVLDEQWLFPNADQLTSEQSAFFQLLFTPAADAQALATQLKSILMTLHGELEKREDAFGLELEFLLRFYQILQRLEDLILKYGTHLSIDMLQRLMRQLARTESLPFSGEPLKGLQLMGLLETRTLDFDRIIILSANEGKLPATKPHHSYIPFAIRKAFGLPTYDEQDSLFAYNVYRLMQRAKEITFIHSNNMSKLNEGEPSRFLQQIEFELANGNDQIQFDRTTVHIPPQFAQTNEIKITKDTGVQSLLQKFTVDGKRYLSPSSIATYVNCPLQFYFSQVLGLREPDDLSEDVDAIKVGNIFHHAMEALYEPRLQKKLTESDYDRFRQKLEEVLLEAYRKNYTRNLQKPVGKNVLNFEFMKRSALKIFDLEQNQSITVKAIETKDFEITLTVSPEDQPLSVSVNGYLDRLDEIDGTTRIIDYKTGGLVEINEKHIADPTPLFTNPKFKANLQGLIYAMLYLEHHPTESVEVGFYHLRDLKKGMKTISAKPIGKGDLEAFKDQLTATVSEIFDPKVPFMQTEDVNRCGYCPFKGICERP